MCNNITFVTRMANMDLYRKSRALIPGKYDTFAIEESDCDTYFTTAIAHTSHKWMINFDEDCFITDVGVVLNIIEFMDKNGYDYCGVPDGGVCPDRKRNNPIVPNAFFNIFNLEKIKPVIDLKEISSSKFEEFMKEYTPHSILRYKYKYDDCEPYYKFFYWLLKKGFKPLFIDADAHTDNLTVFPKFEGKRFCMHTWYARKYGGVSASARAQTQRINARMHEIGI